MTGEQINKKVDSIENGRGYLMGMSPEGATRMMEARRKATNSHAAFFGSGGDKRKDMPAPCFYFAVCGNLEELDKAGRGVCRQCGDAKLKGMEYRLRGPRELIGSGHFAQSMKDFGGGLNGGL